MDEQFFVFKNEVFVGANLQTIYRYVPCLLTSNSSWCLRLLKLIVQLSRQCKLMSGSTTDFDAPQGRYVVIWSTLFSKIRSLMSTNNDYVLEHSRYIIRLELCLLQESSFVKKQSSLFTFLHPLLVYKESAKAGRAKAFSLTSFFPSST